MELRRNTAETYYVNVYCFVVNSYRSIENGEVELFVFQCSHFRIFPRKDEKFIIVALIGFSIKIQVCNNFESDCFNVTFIYLTMKCN